MKNKLFLPGMAMVVAIGMSFATERSSADSSTDYVQTPTRIVEVAEITECGDSDEACMAIVTLGGQPYPVFDSLQDLALGNPKKGGAVVDRITN